MSPYFLPPVLLSFAFLLTSCGGKTDDLIAEAESACSTATSAVLVGGLSQPVAGGTLTYITANNWSIRLQRDGVFITNPAGTGRLEFWGATNSNALNPTHENLNGKHIKDRFDLRRSMTLPGGALITMTSGGTEEMLQTVSIYEDAQSHTVQYATLTAVHSCLNASTAAAREAAEADGETGRLSINAGGGVLFENIYTQGVSASGVPLDKAAGVVKLGETAGPSNPTQVNDFFDDPRLAAT